MARALVSGINERPHHSALPQRRNHPLVFLRPLLLEPPPGHRISRRASAASRSRPRSISIEATATTETTPGWSSAPTEARLLLRLPSAG